MLESEEQIPDVTTKCRAQIDDPEDLRLRILLEFGDVAI